MLACQHAGMPLTVYERLAMTPTRLLQGLLAYTICSHAWASDTDDRWRNGWGQGTSEAEVTHGPGNRIYVACDTGSGFGSSVHFQLVGKPPPPHSDVLLMFDREKPQAAQVDAHGKVRSDCRVCAANFDHLIAALKSHSSVYVRFADGRETTFTLAGSSQAIGACPSNW